MGVHPYIGNIMECLPLVDHSISKAISGPQPAARDRAAVSPKSYFHTTTRTNVQSRCRVSVRESENIVQMRLRQRQPSACVHAASKKINLEELVATADWPGSIKTERPTDRP